MHGLLSFYNITMEELEEQLMQRRLAEAADEQEDADGTVRQRRNVLVIGSVHE